MTNKSEKQLELLTSQNIEIGGKYVFGAGWMEVKSFKILSRKEMVEMEVTRPIRVSVVLSSGYEIEFGMDF